MGLFSREFEELHAVIVPNAVLDLYQRNEEAPPELVNFHMRHLVEDLADMVQDTYELLVEPIRENEGYELVQPGLSITYTVCHYMSAPSAKVDLEKNELIEESGEFRPSYHFLLHITQREMDFEKAGTFLGKVLPYATFAQPIQENPLNLRYSPRRGREKTGETVLSWLGLKNHPSLPR